MTVARALLGATFLTQAASMDLKVGGVIQSSGVGANGKAAIDLWAQWMNDNTDDTVVVTWKDYTDDSALAADVAGFVADSQHIIVCPYTSGLSKKCIDAVPEDSPQGIMVWGGASDSIFYDNCKERHCFGGFTVASGYMSESLTQVHRKLNGPATVGIIANNNGFSRAVAQGAADYVEFQNLLTEVKNVELSVAKTSITDGDKTLINQVLDEKPDIVLVSGHSPDVNEVVTHIKKSANLPNAIIATNAFTSMTYAESSDPEHVIMPTQWNDQSDSKDSIIGWTSADFKTALGDSATYHSASAAALFIRLTHALEYVEEQAALNKTVEIVDAMQEAPLTETFYGVMGFNADGSLNSMDKPMYGVQMQEGDMVYVAPAGDMPMMVMGQYGPSCKDVKTAYKSAKCCGAPDASVRKVEL